MYKIKLVIVFILALSKFINGAVTVARSDSNTDIVLYLNSQPLRASSMVVLPAFTQTSGIIINGQRIPPNARGVVNLRIDMLRSTVYSNPYGTNGQVGGIGEPPMQNNYYYYNSSNPYGSYGNGPYGNGQYTNGGSGYNNGYNNGYNTAYSDNAYGGYTTPYPNRYNSNSFWDYLNIFNRLGR